MGARSSNELHWLDLKVGYQESSSCNDHQGDMFYYPPAAQAVSLGRSGMHSMGFSRLEMTVMSTSKEHAAMQAGWTLCSIQQAGKHGGLGIRFFLSIYLNVIIPTSSSSIYHPHYRHHHHKYHHLIIIHTTVIIVVIIIISPLSSSSPSLNSPWLANY